MGWVEKWINDSETIKNVVERMTHRQRASEGTIATYVKSVVLFSKFLKAHPDKALEEIKKGNADLFKTLDAYIDHELERCAPGTVDGYLWGIKKWLEVNGVDVEEAWKKLERPGKELVEEDRAPNREELKRILRYCNVRDEAVVLIAASSGLRLGTLLSLQIGDVDFDTYNDVAKITVRRAPGRKMKRRKFFCTFITPEAKKSLKEYLGYRRRRGEDLTPESPLIAVYRRKEKSPTRIRSVDVFEVHWARILEKAGLDEKVRRFHVLRFHTLRKFFRTQCINAGVKESYYLYWMGQKGLYLDESYFRAEETKHVEEYRKVIPQLSIVEAPKVLTKEDLTKQIAKIFLGRVEDNELEPIAKEYGMSVETLRNIMARGKPIEKEEGIRTPRIEIPKVVAKKVEKEETEEDCQKIIDEKDLETYLSKDWKYVATLPSGKIIVDNQK